MQAGCAIPAYVGDPSGEYRAARLAAAAIGLPWRRVLAIRGADAVNFLQGMVTQDVGKMNPGEALPGFLLDRKGRIEADLWILRTDEGLLLELQVDRLARVGEILERHRITERMEIAEASSVSVILVTGPRSLEVAERMGSSGWRVRETGGVDLHLLVEDLDGSLVSAASSGAMIAGGRTLERLRIEAGVPWTDREIDGQTLPLQIGGERAISFTKGCYLGQESVARVRYQGRLRRSPRGVRIAGAAEVPPGIQLLRGDVSIGEVTSSAPPPSVGGDTLALALVADDSAQVAEPVLAAGFDAAIESLPFKESPDHE